MSDTEPRLPSASLDDNEFLEGDEVILAVDDYQAIAVLLQNFLRQRGLRTLTAGSAHEFRQILHTVPTALVLLDINLPDGDGTKLISEIKEASPNTAIIMLSAATDLHTALECLRHGA
ncbi:MAG: response regulator, partial [Candidatus Electrothrix sp. LOE2]|nr:response regulator [Candidatus Electrothrix sp. LOE2]